MLKPIKSNQQYEDALARAYTLMQKDLKPNSKDSDELEIISILIKEYENDHYPVSKRDYFSKCVNLKNRGC